MHTNRLLIDEYPLIVQPSLAVALGLNEAMIIQQVHYWCRQSQASGDERKCQDGRWWTYQTYDQWQAQFPFWGSATIRRAIYKLEELGILLSTDEYNRLKMDRTKWYAIDYAALAQHLEPQADEDTAHSSNMISPSDQSEQTSGSERSSPDLINMSRPIPETTQTTSENLSKDKVADPSPQEKERAKERATELMVQGAQTIETETGRALTKNERQGHIRSYKSMILKGYPENELLMAQEMLVAKWTTTRQRPNPQTAHAWAMDGEPVRLESSRESDPPRLPIRDSNIARIEAEELQRARGNSHE